MSTNRLVQFGVLTSEEINLLIENGVRSLDDLQLRLVSDQEVTELAQQMGIDQERLVMAAAAANLLAMKGPGSLVAERVVAGTNWSGEDMYGQELQNLFTFLASADRRELYHWLATDCLKTAQRLSLHTTKRSFWLALALGILASLALLAWWVIQSWPELFPPQVGDFELQLALHLQQQLTRLVFVSFVLLAIMVSSLSVLLFLVSAISQPIISRVGDRILSHRDRLVMAEAWMRLPSRAKRVHGFTNLAPILIYAIMLLISSLAVVLPAFESSIWLGIAWVAGIGLLLLVWTILDLTAWREANVPWLGKTPQRQTTTSLVSSLIISAGLIMSILVWTGIAANSGIPSLADWVLHQADSYEQRFVSDVSQGEYTREAAEYLVEWGQFYTSSWKADSASFLVSWKNSLKRFASTFGSGLLAVLAFIAIMEYFFVNRRNGIGVFVLWLAVFFASELFPDWIVQWIAFNPATIQTSILALGTSLILAIVSGLIGGTGRWQDEKECQSCFLLVAKGDQFCSTCGSRIFTQI